MDEKLLEGIFQEDVIPDYFGDAPSGQSTTTILVGAQPGAGKSSLRQTILQLHEDANAIVIDCDEFRGYHPSYVKIVQAVPGEMAERTHEFASWMASRAIRYANENHYSFIDESTWKRSASALEHIKDANKLQRKLSLIVLSVPPPVSRYSMLRRFCDARITSAPRWVPPKIHETSLMGMKDTVATIAQENVSARFVVLNRDRTSLYDGNDSKQWRNAWEKGLGAISEKQYQQMQEDREVIEKYLPHLSKEKAAQIAVYLKYVDEINPIDVFLLK